MIKYKKEAAAEYRMLSIKKHRGFGGYSSFVLGGDVGGTNTSLGIFGIKNNKAEFLISFLFKSNELATTETLLNAMARPANSARNKPNAAIGIPTLL